VTRRPAGQAVPRAARQAARLALTGLLALAVAACSGGLILANPPLVVPSPPGPTPAPSRAADPVPIAFPRDDGPHDRLTEWWYYTGHLVAADGRHFGFEFVIFRAERGDVPVTWASHVALTDEGGNLFSYAQRSEVGPQVVLPTATPFSRHLQLTDPDVGPGWEMLGGTLGGNEELDQLSVGLSPSEASTAGRSFGLALELETTTPTALHNGNGWISFGPAGGSYYYSRTSLRGGGTLTLDGQKLSVRGTAWFDHQWGDFISVGGGWDWFAMNLENGTDVTMSFVRGVDGSLVLAYGTLVDPSGEARHLEPPDMTVTSTGTWTSPTTAAVYPAGWSGSIRSASLAFQLSPTVADQELDTRATTGVVYWEGSQRVTATVAGAPVGGNAYVELTGYAPAPAPAPSASP